MRKKEKKRNVETNEKKGKKKKLKEKKEERSKKRMETVYKALQNPGIYHKKPKSTLSRNPTHPKKLPNSERKKNEKFIISRGKP